MIPRAVGLLDRQHHVALVKLVAGLGPAAQPVEDQPGPILPEPVGEDWVIPTELVDAVLKEGPGEDVPPEERVLARPIRWK